MIAKIELNDKLKEDEIIIQAREINEDIAFIINFLNKQNKISEHILAFLGDKAKLIHIKDVVNIYTENNEIFLNTLDNKYLIKTRLYEIEENFSSFNIIRISNSELINLNMADEFDFSFSGTISVKLKNNKISYVSRRNINKIKKILGL